MAVDDQSVNAVWNDAGFFFFSLEAGASSEDRMNGCYYYWIDT